MVDRKGTCHLVGCVGKGIHGPEGPHSKPSDPPSPMGVIKAHIEANNTRIAATYGFRKVSKGPIDKIIEPVNIGAPDSWTPYEGGPLIPKPEPECCLGFPIIEVGTTGVAVFCSIVASSWSFLHRPGVQLTAAGLVDEHKRDCPNRKARS